MHVILLDLLAMQGLWGEARGLQGPAAAWRTQVCGSDSQTLMGCQPG